MPAESMTVRAQPTAEGAPKACRIKACRASGTSTVAILGSEAGIHRGNVCPTQCGDVNTPTVQNRFESVIAASPVRRLNREVFPLQRIQVVAHSIRGTGASHRSGVQYLLGSPTMPAAMVLFGRTN